ncbi:MAG: 50S ribosome-binding GTPase [Nanoarchaeota archaeon]|nr:50S ribosome-binding GTPase [Nanoarchaeota archaeon]
MPINVNDPEYTSAEKEYYESNTIEEKLTALKKMISHAPKHKGGENLRQQLTTRRKKLEQELIKKQKSGKRTSVGIKKSDMQAILVGKTNSGKSTLLKLLTNAEPRISDTKFTTTKPIIGMLGYASTQIQIIENPAIDSDYYDKGLTNTADTILIIVNTLEGIKEILEKIPKAQGKKIIVFNNKKNLDERKISATLQSKKYNFLILSQNLDELKEKIFQSFDKIRVYTKEPGKPKSPKPIIMKPHSTIFEVAEKILHGFSKNVKETKIWGPSSKFAGQKVGLKHKLKDLDVVEFKTR